MTNLRISSGLYLLNKKVATTAAPVQTEVPTKHIIVIDCSGSMAYVLQEIRQQLKNKLSMMIKETDTVTIVWFSGKTQYGIVVEDIPLRTAVDLSGVHRSIDNFLKPIGLTGFVEPLKEVAALIDRIQQPGYAINLFFMSDGCDNQWSKEQILAAVDVLNPLVSSAAIVEYGWYCNRPLMVQMSERLGATEVLAESFMQYDPIFETAMTKKIAGVKKIEASLDTAALHGFAFTIQDGEVLTFAVDNRKVSVPEGTGEIFWFAELPSMANFSSLTEIADKDKAETLRGVYASLIPLTQRMLSNDIFRVLKATGDVRLIREFTNCFGKQAYLGFQNMVAECVGDPGRRLLNGYNPDEVPAEDAFTIIDLLYELASDDHNLFYPNHEAFDYERIGRKAVNDRMLTEAESQRVAEIALELGKTRNPSKIKALQQELSALSEDKEGVKFTPDDPDAGYPVSNLVFNEDRPNISAQVRIPGTVDLTDLMEGSPIGRHGATLEYWVEQTNMIFYTKFPTHIHRNYTIVRDGIRNVKVLPVSLTAESHRKLSNAGVFSHQTYQPYADGEVYEIDLTKLPLINRKMVKDVSAKNLFDSQWELTNEKAKQKVFKYYFDEYFPPESSAGIADKYGPEAAAWLADLGIKDYGFSPKVTLAEATEAYMGRELQVSISGLSSLPSVKSVLDKLEAKKKLTTREIVLGPAIAEVKGFLDSPAYKSVGDKAKNDLLHVWLTSRKRDTISHCRKLMREIAQIKFSIIVGQTWPVEWASLDENSLTMRFDGQDVVCTANLREVEVKV